MAIFDKLEETLHSILSSRRKCKILGDININTPVNNTKTKENWNLIRSEEFTPLIFEATRITEISESSIDHIHAQLLPMRYLITCLFLLLFMILNTVLFQKQLKLGTLKSLTELDAFLSGLKKW